MKFKSILATAIAISVLTASVAAFAEKNNKINPDDVLKQFGYESSIVSTMGSDDKESISKAILQDPNSVQMSKSYLVVDNLSIFEYYTNTTDEELLKNNENAENIKRIRASLKKIDSLSKEEFENKYSVSPGEYKLIKKALTKNPDYKHRNHGDKKVSTSGTLDSSWMSYSMTKVNNSTATAPSYDITISYDWQKTYFCDMYNDKIAVAWGGGLNVKNISSYASYFNGNYFSSSWGGMYTFASMACTQTPNAGLTFSTPQAKFYNNYRNEAENKCGTVRATIYQTKFRGYDTNLISEFCHQESTYNTSISIGYNTAYASITPGTSYTTTPEQYLTIRY